LHRFKGINQFLIMAPSPPDDQDNEVVLGKIFSEAVTEIMAIDPGKASQNWRDNVLIDLCRINTIFYNHYVRPEYEHLVASRLRRQWRPNASSGIQLPSCIQPHLQNKRRSIFFRFFGYRKGLLSSSRSIVISS
jgi:hypothetical protein